MKLYFLVYDGLCVFYRIVGALFFRDCIRDLFLLFGTARDYHGSPFVSFFQSFFSIITQAGQVILASPVMFALAVWDLAHKKSGGFDL